MTNAQSREALSLLARARDLTLHIRSGGTFTGQGACEKVWRNTLDRDGAVIGREEVLCFDPPGIDARKVTALDDEIVAFTGIAEVPELYAPQPF